jgi:hypothetical protein
MIDFQKWRKLNEALESNKSLNESLQFLLAVKPFDSIAFHGLDEKKHVKKMDNDVDVDGDDDVDDDGDNDADDMGGKDGECSCKKNKGSDNDALMDKTKDMEPTDNKLMMKKKMKKKMKSENFVDELEDQYGNSFKPLQVDDTQENFLMSLRKQYESINKKNYSGLSEDVLFPPENGQEGVEMKDSVKPEVDADANGLEKFGFETLAFDS